MGAAVTNYGELRQQWATGTSKALILGATLSLSLSAFARVPFPSSSTDYIYVQAPSLSSSQSHVYQPVVAPAPVPNGEWDHVGHLWPRMVSYSMETDSVEAYVQPDLRLGMQYNYSFNFELNARNSQGRATAIPQGWYQLQIAVIRKANGSLKGKQSRTAHDRYVTSASMFLRVSNGSFGRKVSLRFPDITATAIKHHLFVELIPLKDECEIPSRTGPQKGPCINLNAKGEPDPLNSILEPRPGFKTYLVEMPFTPFHPSGGKVRDADDLSAEDQAFLGGSLAMYIAQAQLMKNRAALFAKKASTPAQHADRYRLNYKDLNDPDFAPAQAKLRKLLQDQSLGTIKISEDSKSLFQTLCEQLNAHQSKYQKWHKANPFLYKRNAVIHNQIRWCAEDPAKYMRLSRVVHVGRPIAGKIERIAQKNLTYTIMANYMSNRSHSNDVVSSVNLKAPSILVKFMDQIGLGAGHSVSFSNSRSTIESGLASMATSLDFNYVVFNVPTVGSQQCLEVRGLPDLYEMFYNPQENARNGFYICAPKSDSPIETPEVYAHAFERCRDTTMMECDALTQSVNVSMRGEREISAFFYAIRGGITPDHNNRVMPFGDVEGAEQFFASTPAPEGKELVTPIEFPRETIPSFLQQISGSYREIFD